MLLHMKGRQYMNLQEIDLKKIYRIWKSDLGHFQCFFRSTPFVSLQTYDDFTLSEEYINEYDSKIASNYEREEEINLFLLSLPKNFYEAFYLISNLSFI